MSRYPDLIQATAAMDAVTHAKDVDDPRVAEARRAGLRLCREYATHPVDVFLEIHFPREVASIVDVLTERLNAAVPDADPWAEVRQPVSPDYVTLALRVALTAPAEVLDHLQATLDLEEQLRGAVTEVKNALGALQALRGTAAVDDPTPPE